MKMLLSAIQLLQILVASCIPLRVTGLPQRSAPMARIYPTQPATDALSLLGSEAVDPPTAEALRTRNASHDEEGFTSRQLASRLDLFQPSLTLRLIGTDDGYQSRSEPLSQLVNARRDAVDRVSRCHSCCLLLSCSPTDLDVRRADPES